MPIVNLLIESCNAIDVYANICHTLFCMFTANRGGVCADNGEIDKRYAIYAVQYLLQTNFGDLDHTSICHFIGSTLFRTEGI